MTNFAEYDPDTPTEADLDQAYGSKYLSATGVGDRKIKTTIKKVRKEEFRGNDGTKQMKFVLHLENFGRGAGARARQVGRRCHRCLC